MKKQRIFIAKDPVLDELFDQVAERLLEKGHVVILGEAALLPEKTTYLPDCWQEYFLETNVILTSTRTIISDDILNYAKKLKGVVFPSIGTETINISTANREGIIVAHGSTAENYESMAEATVMLIAGLFLDLQAKLKQFRDMSVRPPPSQLKARMVSGRVIGLIGYGKIAREVVKRLSGWGVKIVVYTQTPDLSEDIEYVSLNQLLGMSDLVSLHLPLNSKTAGSFNSECFHLMKEGAYFVNTSRGGIVDESALVKALQTGKISGAAIDVFEKEPPNWDHPLRKMENVILTQHIIGHTRELYQSLVPMMVDNIERILNDQQPVCIKNPEVLDLWQKRIRCLEYPDCSITSSL